MGRKDILCINWDKARKYLTKYDLEDIRCSIKTLENLDIKYKTKT
mgnify:CR=1 FL=1